MRPFKGMIEVEPVNDKSDSVHLCVGGIKKKPPDLDPAGFSDP